MGRRRRRGWFEPGTVRWWQQQCCRAANNGGRRSPAKLARGQLGGGRVSLARAQGRAAAQMQRQSVYGGRRGTSTRALMDAVGGVGRQARR